MSASPATATERPIEFDRSAQLRTALLGAAFVAAFWHQLDFIPSRFGAVVHRWITESDWSHGPIIPLFAIWLVRMHWERLRAAPVRHTWVGLLVLLGGLAAYEWFLWGFAIGYFRAAAMLVCLLGAVLYLRGLGALRYVWLPWLYLFFAVPLPKAVYFQLTDPLRQMAATVATSVLSLLPELTIARAGSIINYTYASQSGVLGVADACSGMRSTMALCALGVAVTFLSARPWWQRVIMVASCVPIAVLSNFVRVTATCVLYIFADPKYAEGTYHTVLGLATLMLAFGVFSGLGWVLPSAYFGPAKI